LSREVGTFVRYNESKDTERLSGKKMHVKTGLSALMALCFVIMSGLRGCPLFEVEPNEADSVKNICSISITDCDYSFHTIKNEMGYRIGDKREYYIGNWKEGMSFDGEKAYQFDNGMKRPIDQFPFEKYDASAGEILEISQKIISNGFYTAYNDESSSYNDILYHFLISEEGLALFQDQNFTYGLILAVYRDGVFENFSIVLKKNRDALTRTFYEFGTIRQTISFSSSLID
jgi:hypothetical protein